MRILVADDEPQVIEAYRVCFDQTGKVLDDVDALGGRLFGGLTSEHSDSIRFSRQALSADFVRQGADAVEAVRRAVREGQPYAVLFLDMRMPPGIDGRETARQIRAIDPEINIVVVSGYSDHSPLSIAQVAGPQDKLYFVAKPFQMAEIQTLAHSLATKWVVMNHAFNALAEKVAELEEAQVQIKANEAYCRNLALHDHLTKLPNRYAFQQNLDAALADRQAEVAVLFLDLDRFKLVNDTLGHQAGDELVCRLGDRMSASLPSGGLVARLGGDEFGIILHGPDAENAEAIAQQLIALCVEPHQLQGGIVTVGASIGLAFRGSSNADSNDLLRRADLALYAAKGQGRGCCRCFEPEMDEGARKRADIHARLVKALDDDILRLVYQPIVDPDHGGAAAFEALVRWTDAELGIVPPDTFVPIAEETGLILKLGEWVVRRALSDCAKWPCGTVSINLSTRQFQSPQLIDFVVTEAARAGVTHDRIQLEVTETALFDDMGLAARVLSGLRAEGFTIALDDFGTGYSSLVNLKDFEIDCLKIDRSFVMAIGEDYHTAAIINALTSLARVLGLKVVAEGVETATQIQALRMVGCSLMQGFYFGQPMEVSELQFDSAVYLPDSMAELAPVRLRAVS